MSDLTKRLKKAIARQKETAARIHAHRALLQKEGLDPDEVERDPKATIDRLQTEYDELSTSIDKMEEDLDEKLRSEES